MKAPVAWILLPALSLTLSCAPAQNKHVESPQKEGPAASDAVENTQGSGNSGVVSDLRSGFRQCFQTALATEPMTEGRISLRIHIGADGHVVRTEARAAGTLTDAVIQCVEDVAGRAKFSPPEDGKATVSVPITFTHQ